MISQYFQVLAYLFYPKNNTLQEGAEWTQVELQLGHFELGLSFLYVDEMIDITLTY